jgi:hypothetical protein
LPRLQEDLRAVQTFSEDSVHEFRVESRRLLATLGVLSPIIPDARLDRVRRVVKGRLRALARLRDTQVQLVAIEELEQRFEALGGLRRRLAKRARRLTKDAARKLRRARGRTGRSLDEVR